VYRRVLYQARSNDLLVDPSEAALLGVLRQELEISQIEHFLIEHHADLREFWKQDEAFARELLALRSAGLVYARDGKTLLPEDLVTVIRNVLGLDMSCTAARRLYGYLSNQDLYEALAAIHAPTSGSKDEKVERLVAHMAQPRIILRVRGISGDELRNICRDIGANVSGSKDELVARIIAHVATDRDLRREAEPPPPIVESRRLDRQMFSTLFSELRGQDLAAILGEFDLRRWGTKEMQIDALWESHRSEETLLNCLLSADLEGLLRRLDLKTGGSKSEKISRALDHFSGLAPENVMTTTGSA
jgi:PAS domain-containing protein